MFSENDKIYRSEAKSLLETVRGEFAKRVLVVVQDEPAHPGNLDFLKKILALLASIWKKTHSLP